MNYKTHLVSNKKTTIGRFLFSAAFLLAAICFWTAGAREASAQVPGGSYQQSCKNYQMTFGHLLTASCRNKAGNDVSTRLRYTFLCSGDISNNDGNLTCVKTADSPQFKSAVEAFNSASVVALGRPPKSTSIFEGAGFIPDSELLRWLAEMHNYEMGQTYKDGMNFSHALSVLKKYASIQPSVLNEIVNNALTDVYGTVDSAKFNEWSPQVKAQTAWYLTILNAEKGKLNKDKAARAAMLHRVYQAAMGRDAEQGDLAYWEPLTDIYRDVLAANRNWLYSDRGREDLVATVWRAHGNKLHPETKNKQAVIEAMAAGYIKEGAKKIYVEMIASK